MKKNLLTAFAMIATVGASFAQTFVNGSTGYTTTYGTAGNSCSVTANTTARINGDQANENAAVIDPTTGYFKFTANPTIAAAGATPQWCGILATFGTGPTATCGYLSNTSANANNTVYGVDMSAAGNSKVAITAKSDVDGAQLIFHLAHSNASWNAGPSTYNQTATVGGASITRTITLTTTMAEYVIDFADQTADATVWNGIANKDQINFFGFDARTANAVYEIGGIKYGTDVPTSTSSANVVNDQVNLFPNPAKGSFNVDITAMQVESAAVKVMNSNGIVVKEFTASDIATVSTEGLVKGIYMVQVTSGNKVANKKLVVE